MEKLKDWNAQSQATMANYEKIKVVGKGELLHQVIKDCLGGHVWCVMCDAWP